MKFLFDLGGVFFDWDPYHYYKDVFINKKERNNFLENICNDQWNIQQDAGRTIKEAESEIIKFAELSNTQRQIQYDPLTKI